MTPDPAVQPASIGGAPAQGRGPTVRLAIYLLLTAAVLFFVGRALIQGTAAIDWSTLRLHVGLLVLGAGCLLAHELAAAFTLHVTLKAFGQSIGPGRSIIAYLAALLGKYLPGKVGTVAGAVALLRRFGVRTSLALGATFLHTALTTALGLMLAAPLLLSGPLGREAPAGWPWGLAAAVVGLACLHPKLFVRLSNVLLRRTGREPISAHTKNRYVFAVIAIIPLRFGLLGTGVWLIARSLTPTATLGEWPTVAATAAAATVIGFLAFFTPAGLGVREGIYAVLLGGVLGTGPAALLALLVRFCQTGVDLITGGAGIALARRTPAVPIGPQPADD